MKKILIITCLLITTIIVFFTMQDKSLSLSNIMFTNVKVDGTKSIKALVNEEGNTLNFNTNHLLYNGDQTILEYQVRNNTNIERLITLECFDVENGYLEIDSKFNNEKTPSTVLIRSGEVLKGKIRVTLVNEEINKEDRIDITCSIIEELSNQNY